MTSNALAEPTAGGGGIQEEGATMLCVVRKINASAKYSPHMHLPADASKLQTGVAMVGKFGISASFAVIYVYTAEIFPTVLRQVSTRPPSFHTKSKVIYSL